MSTLGPELLARLMDEHGAALALYARQWCACPEDAVQDALLQLVREPRLPDNVVAWLYRVVRNRAISTSRAAGARSRHEATAAFRGEPWFAATDEDRLDAESAAQALTQLPLPQRETIVARIWGGLSFEEIAALLETSTSTVHRWYHAGLVALRDRLGVERRAK
jgi:RNA polymerase sigma-70 factor (ECF subfamily)